MASGGAPFNAQSLSLFADDQFRATEKLVKAESMRRYTDRAIAENFEVLETIAGNFDYGAAVLSVRAALDSTNARQSVNEARDALNFRLRFGHSHVQYAQFHGIRVASKTVKYKDVTTTHTTEINPFYAGPNYSRPSFRAILAHGAGKSNVTGRGDTFGSGAVKSYTIEVVPHNMLARDDVMYMAITISGTRATLDTCSGGFMHGLGPYSEGPHTLAAIRRFAVSVGALVFDCDADTDEHTCASWIRGE